MTTESASFPSAPTPPPTPGEAVPAPPAEPPASSVSPVLSAAPMPAPAVTEPAAPPLAEPPLLAPPPVSHAFVFHGSTHEYFRIWIVNTLLTLVTCGLFAPWAKVRKRRYLRGNTELLGHRFDYRADPRRILLGNIIVVALFLCYAVLGNVYLWARLGALGVGLVLLPWIIVRSQAFNAHNTSYRGMRFYFHQTYGMAALTYLGHGALLVPSLGFYYPAWMRIRREFSINNHRLGDAFFKFQGASGPFYSAYLIASLMIGAVGFVGAMLMGALMVGAKHKIPTLLDQLPFWCCYGFVLYVGRHYIYAKLFNHVWNHTQLDDHRFRAKMETKAWLKLQIVNLGGLLISAGLLYPWAAVRSARYALSCLSFEPAGPLEHIERLGKDEGSALGDSAGEFVGMDIGL